MIRLGADPTYPAFPIFSFLGFVLVLIPLPWHLQAWNAGTCLFMVWTGLSCFISFVNSLVWRSSVLDVAPTWCDISTRLAVGIAVAIPAASLCINRRLYKIASCQTVSISKAQKRRAVLVDLAIGLGIPFVQMPLQYVVQGHRYDIIENVGCYPTTYNVVPAYPLSYLWPNIIGLISATYCIFTLRAFMHRRAQFTQFLSSTTGLTPQRYFRLMALASLELLLNIPLSSYGLYLSASRGAIAPWISWADTHAGFDRVEQVPAVLWRGDAHTQATVELSRWAGVVCALAFFAFFGFAAEARKHYRMAFWAVAGRCGVKRPADGALPFSLPWSKGKSTSSSAGPTLPISLPRTPAKRRPDSLSPSLADTSTDFDFDGTGSESHVEKADYALATPAPPEYLHDIELGAYSPSHPMRPEYPMRPDASPSRPARPSTWPSLYSPTSPPAAP